MAESQDRELDLIAVGAHPDDVEIACGGTLARLARKGYAVGIVDLTDGEPTPHSPGPDVRLAEADRAALVLGGAAWSIALTSLGSALLTSVPMWVRSRTIALSMLASQGFMAAGAALWGAVASHAGIEFALAFASGLMVVLLIWGYRYPVVLGDQSDVTLSPTEVLPPLSTPVAAAAVDARAGPDDPGAARARAAHTSAPRWEAESGPGQRQGKRQPGRRPRGAGGPAAPHSRLVPGSKETKARKSPARDCATTPGA